jgi:glycerol-3-phosphate acyltransferase PlsY
VMPVGGFYFFGSSPTAWVLVVIAALLFWRHRTNIRQLLEGKEKAIGR